MGDYVEDLTPAQTDNYFALGLDQLDRDIDGEIAMIDEAIGGCDRNLTLIGLIHDQALIGAAVGDRLSAIVLRLSDEARASAQSLRSSLSDLRRLILGVR